MHNSPPKYVMVECQESGDCQDDKYEVAAKQSGCLAVNGEFVDTIEECLDHGRSICNHTCPCTYLLTVLYVHVSTPVSCGRLTIHTYSSLYTRHVYIGIHTYISANMSTDTTEDTLTTGPAAAGVPECMANTNGPDCQAAWNSVANSKDQNYEGEFYKACDSTGYWGSNKEQVFICACAMLVCMCACVHVCMRECVCAVQEVLHSHRPRK